MRGPDEWEEADETGDAAASGEELAEDEEAVDEESTDVLREMDNPEIAEMRRQVRETNCLSDMFRKELESYLGDLDHKLDSEGRSLVHVPKNFDEIVGAMTREDLLSDDKSKGWYSTLMEDQVDRDMNREFGGRYRGVLATPDDNKIQRGMAEIMMLDRQLQMLNNRAKATDRPITGGDDASSVGSPSATPRSRTFITKTGSRSELPSRMKTERKPRSPSPPNDQEKLDDNGNLRIEELLLMDDDEFQRAFAFLPEGFTSQNALLDQQLEAFHRLDRLTTPSEEEAEVKETAAKRAKARKADYLTQQRQERAEREAEQAVDGMLAQCSRELADYSSLLVDPEQRDGRPRPGRAQFVQSLLEVPRFEELHVGVPITRADIAQLLQDISAEDAAGGTINPLPPPLSARLSHSSLAPMSPERQSVSLPRPPNAQLPVASKDDIQQLVDKYSAEIARLDSLRAAIHLNRELSASAELQALTSGVGSTVLPADPFNARPSSAESRPGSSSSSACRERLLAAIEDDLDYSQLLSQSVDLAFSADDLLPLKELFGSAAPAEAARSPTKRRQMAVEIVHSSRDRALPRIDPDPQTFVLPSSRRVHSREGGDGEVEAGLGPAAGGPTRAPRRVVI